MSAEQLMRLNVCLLNDSFPPVVDGVANAVKNYADIINEKFGNAMVVAPAYPDAQDDYGYPVVRYQSFNTEKLVGYRTGNPLAGGVLGKVGEFAPDILHLHCPFASAYIAMMAREVTEAPIVYTYHTKFDIDIARTVKMKSLREPSIKAIVSNISACDDVWVVSKGAGENLRGLGFDGEYTVMENGVDFPRGKAEGVRIDAINKRHALTSADIPVFLFTGRLMWYKGIDIIISALKMLHDAGEDFRMIFVGSGLEEDEIKKSVKKHGIDEKCIFTGSISDREELRAYFSRADMFVFPSTFDTNGIVVREAAACGTPSALIEGSCAAEGVTDGVDGYLIKNDPASLYELLKRACANLAGVHEVGKNAMNNLYISWEDSVTRAYERYIYVYEKFTGMRKNSAVKRGKVAQTMAEMLENMDKNKR